MENEICGFLGPFWVYGHYYINRAIDMSIDTACVLTGVYGHYYINRAIDMSIDTAFILTGIRLLLGISGGYHYGYWIWILDMDIGYR